MSFRSRCISRISRHTSRALPLDELAHSHARYARYQGCTQAYQSIDVCNLQQRLLAAKHLTKAEYDAIKFEFRLTPRTSDLWSAGLIALAMFEGPSRVPSLVPGVPPWFASTLNFRGGGEVALDELERFVGSRVAFDDARAWGCEEVLSWVSQCGCLGKHREAIVKGLREADPPIDGPTFLSFAVLELKKVRKQLGDLKVPSATALKNAVKEGFGLGIPTAFEAHLRRIFDPDAVRRPLTDECVEMMQEWRDCVPSQVARLVSRPHSDEDISRTLRNLGNGRHCGFHRLSRVYS